MVRVRGLETEYGLQVRVRPLDAASPVGWRRLSSDEASRVLFEPVVQANAATSVFLRNGGRLYLDVGSHPEYATAECSTLAELIAQDRAGDLILSRLAGRAREALAEQGLAATVAIFKNNVDSHGNSYGSHENFQVARTSSLEAMVQALVPFLTTRQLICGAGHWQRDRSGAGRFVLSQRAAHMWDPLGSGTTRSRPMVNTRDEPHADAQRFRRLHVIVGDSTMLDHSTLLRVGSMELVLRAVEAGERFAGVQVPEPGRTIREVSTDLGGQCAVTSAGHSTLEVQRLCWQAAEPFVDDEELAEVHRLWDGVLRALEDRAPERLAGHVDWVAKHRLLQAQRARHQLADDDPRLAQLDLAWHDIVEGQGLARISEQRGQVWHWLAPGAAHRAVDEPPSTTRAALRSAFLTVAQQHQREHQVDWMRFSCHDLADGTVVVDDASTTRDQAVETLLGRMADEPRRAASSSFATRRRSWGPSELG